MRRVLLAACLLLGVGVLPALAAPKQPDPCRDYVPTGAALPREDVMARDSKLSPTPTPTSRDKPTGVARKGELVTVLRECGRSVQIRDPRQAVGWTLTDYLPNERRLMESARTARSVVAGRENPCDRYLPTGAPLPRQDVMSNSSRLFDIPNPGYRDPPVAQVERGEQVTVLQECGQVLRVRALMGAEGWVNVALLSNERKLAENARNRPVASPEDCDARFSDARVAGRCREELAAKLSDLDEMRGSLQLTGDEMAAYLAGNSFAILERGANGRNGTPSHQHFAANGEFFLSAGQGGMATRWRGRWIVENSVLCMPGGFQPCYRFRRTPRGEIVWMGENGQEYVATLENERTATILADTQRYAPNAAPELPAKPDNGDGQWAPSLRSQ